MSTPSAPAPINYGQETADTLNAQVANAGGVYNANATYDPQYTALQLQDLTTALNGTPGQQGYLSEYTNTILPQLTAADTAAQAAQGAGTVANLQNLAPGAAAAFNAVNPGGSALQQQLTQTASDQLKLGTQLDPGSVSQINNAVTQSWANRGLGTSSPAMLDQALQLNAGGQNLLQQRESNASSVSGQDYSQALGPLQAILGTVTGTPTAVSSAGGVTGTAGSAVSQVPGINPESNIAADMASSNMNATAAANIAGSNSTDALIGAGIGAL